MQTLVIHGGAGAREGAHSRFEEYATHLASILERSYPVLQRSNAREGMLHTIRLLEEDPIFNAGTGSRIQRDGKIRMSAAIMGSSALEFSGVINIEDVAHPIEVAQLLGREGHKVLAGEGAQHFAREHGVAAYDPLTSHRLAEFESRRVGTSGTVGAVALDADGDLWVGTSTGGVGFEIPGRVSDSATVAGNYAGHTAGVSCTGTGEHIVNHAAAARVVTRVEDGQSLTEAVNKTIAEANVRGCEYGLIALDRSGTVATGQTDGITTVFAVHDGTTIRTFLERVSV